VATGAADGENGFLIDGHCTTVDETCSREYPIQLSKLSTEEEKENWFYNPRSLSICQNMTFWLERRMRTRKAVIYSVILLPYT
jgi:hypothetical protein